MATSAPHVMLPEEEEKVQHLLFGSDWVNGEKWEETVCKLAGMMGHIATHSHMRFTGQLQPVGGNNPSESPGGYGENHQGTSFITSI